MGLCRDQERNTTLLFTAIIQGWKFPQATPAFPAAEVCAKALGSGFVLLERCWRTHRALTLFIPGHLGMSRCLVGFLSHRNSSVHFSLPWAFQENKPCLVSHHFLPMGSGDLLPATLGRDGLYGIGVSLKVAGGKFRMGPSIPKKPHPNRSAVQGKPPARGNEASASAALRKSHGEVNLKMATC